MAQNNGPQNYKQRSASSTNYQSAFLVKHFADTVEYECEGFLHKNKDTVMEEQIVVLKGSSNKLLSNLFISEGKTKPESAISYLTS